MSEQVWHPAYIGLGSNLESPLQHVRSAFEALAELPDTVLVLRSSLYRSAPLGPANQPDFINAVAALLTRLPPVELLSRLQAIETAHGRQRDTLRWGPRTLDLDLLSYGRVRLDSTELVLPHPGIAERNFVLLPWQEIAPWYRVPGLATVAELAGRLSMHDPAITMLDT